MKKLVLDAVKTREQKDDVVALGSDVFENRLRTLELRAAALEYAREI